MDSYLLATYALGMVINGDPAWAMLLDRSREGILKSALLIAKINTGLLRTERIIAGCHRLLAQPKWDRVPECMRWYPTVQADTLRSKCRDHGQNAGNETSY